MLTTLNKQLERWMPLITPTSVLIGLATAGVLSPFTGWVPWIFAFMTFAGSLSMNVKDLQRVILHPQPIVVFLFILHIVMPLIAWGVGHAAFEDSPLTITGLLLVLTIPTGIVSFMWVTIYRGNTALTLSMILIDTMLSPFIVPMTLSLLVGAKVQMNTMGMLTQLMWMVVVPSIAGMLMNQVTGGKVKTSWSPILSPISKIGLVMVIVINSSVVAPFFTEWNWNVVYIAAVCIVIVSLGYGLGWGAARLLRFNRDMAVSMVFNCGMRNVSAGAVLAISFFPPQVVLPTIIGMLTQQLMASFYGYLFFRQKTPKANRVPIEGAIGVSTK